MRIVVTDIDSRTFLLLPSDIEQRTVVAVVDSTVVADDDDEQRKKDDRHFQGIELDEKVDSNRLKLHLFDTCFLQLPPVQLLRRNLRRHLSVFLLLLLDDLHQLEDRIHLHLRRLVVLLHHLNCILGNDL